MSKTKKFLIALSLLVALSAAEEPLRLMEDAIAYDRNDPRINLVIELRLAVNALKDINHIEYWEGRLPPENLEAAYYAKIKERREKIAGCIARLPNDATKETIIIRTDNFLKGIVNRCLSVYQPILNQYQQSIAELRQCLSEHFNEARNTYIVLPEPLSSTAVLVGAEQSVCDRFTVIVNRVASYKRERALLVGLRKIDENQLIMFLTGSQQMSKDGQVVILNKDMQDLYESYSDPNSTLEKIQCLEYNAIQHLIGDGDRVSFDFYDSIVYVPGAIYPRTEKRTETLDKRSIMQILSQAAETSAHHVMQKQAPVVSVKEIKMFTDSDVKLLGTIMQTMTVIQVSLKESGYTPAGYTQNECIMDYGTENGRTSITPEMRSNIKDLLERQFKRRGIIVSSMEEYSSNNTPFDKIPERFQRFAERNFENKDFVSGRLRGVYAVAGTLINWVNEMQMPFNAEEIKNISTVLFAMADSLPKNMNENTDLQLLNSLWRMHHLYKSYQNWHNARDKEEFLSSLKSKAIQCFTHVLCHYNPAGLLKCKTGARGRAFLVNFSMIDFLSEKHPLWEVRQ